MAVKPKLPKVYIRVEKYLTPARPRGIYLIRSAYRKKGDRLMMEGEKMYYEISAGILVDFKQPGRHTYEFIELYGSSVYRITKVKFYSKY